MDPPRKNQQSKPARASISLPLILLVFTFLLGILAGQLRFLKWDVQCWPWAVIGSALAAFTFGALVGLYEILSRYRDEPLRASFNAFGLAYLFLNGLIAVAALALLRIYSSEIFPSISGDLFLTSVVAGFGAMVVMRSKLFTFNTPDGKEYAIGPAIVLDTILHTIDQKIDRLRATQRQERVYEKLRGMSDFEWAAQYLESSLLSFQNLSQEQKEAITGVISDYRDSPWDDRLKIMALGYAYLTIAGEENFNQVVEKMRSLSDSREEDTGEGR